MPAPVHGRSDQVAPDLAREVIVAHPAAQLLPAMLLLPDVAVPERHCRPALVVPVDHQVHTLRSVAYLCTACSYLPSGAHRGAAGHKRDHEHGSGRHVFSGT